MFSKRKFALIGSSILAATILVACTEKEDTSAPAKDTPTELPVNSKNNIVVTGDTINSHLIEDAICVVNSRFEQGQRLVFRADVTDLEKDVAIEDAKIKVILGTGETFDMVRGPHGEEATLLYSVGWTIPEDFPTGTLDYKYVAEVNGEEYIYEPFNVSLSKLTIVDSTAAATPSQGEAS